MKKLKIILDRI